MDLTLNNLQWLWYAIKPKQAKSFGRNCVQIICIKTSWSYNFMQMIISYLKPYGLQKTTVFRI